METLEDELDLRYHKGLDPDVYYRCPTTEVYQASQKQVNLVKVISIQSLEGALQNELDRSASALIPTKIVTEFVFAVASTITVPVTQQLHLGGLLQTANFLQSVSVEYALCRNIDGEDRLKIQRAIARYPRHNSKLPKVSAHTNQVYY